MPEPAKLLQLTPRGPVLIVTVVAEQLSALEATDEFVDELNALLATRPEKHWIVDFRSVSFMVTAAVNALVHLAKQLQTRGGQLVLAGLSPNVRQIFELMRLESVLRLAADADAAMKLLAGR